jgi:ABC-2 type transport system permease protein
VNGIWAVCRRDLAGFFNQPVAYVVITAYLLICGWFFTSNLFLAGQADIRGFLAISPMILVFFTPALTMRLLAEEWKNGTMELLVTLPLKDSQVVIGKYLAVFGVFAVAQGLSLIYPLTVAALGPLDVGQAVSGYLGILLLGAAFLAIGLFASALSNSQVVAFIVSFFFCFGLYLLGKMLPLVPDSLVPLVEFLAVDGHYGNLVKGVVDSRDVLYFVSIVVLCLAATVHSLQGRKWGR